MEEVTSRRRALKGSGIVIAEDLTKINAARYQKVRELSGVVRAWTKRGEIYAIGQNGRILKKAPSMELSQFNRVLTDHRNTPHHTAPLQVRQRPSYAMPATRQEPAHQEQPSARPKAAENAAGDISAVFPSRGPMPQNSVCGLCSLQSLVPRDHVHQPHDNREKR